MSEYIRTTYGPGDIAALPPTIGSSAGHQTQPRPQYRPGATMVRTAGVKLPMNGMVGMGEGEGTSSPWLAPIGIGLVLGGLYVMFAKKREHGGILPNARYGKDDEEYLDPYLPPRGMMTAEGKVLSSLEMFHKSPHRYIKFIPRVERDQLSASLGRMVKLAEDDGTRKTYSLIWEYLGTAYKMSPHSDVVMAKALDMAVLSADMGYPVPKWVEGNLASPYASYSRMVMNKKRGGILPNMDEPTCNGCGATPNPSRRRRPRRNG